MDAWVLWLIIALGLAIAEVLSLTFVLAMISAGAIAAAIAAAAGVPTVGQLIIFGVADASLLAGVLPVARRHLHQPATLRSGTARLIGMRAMSLTPIDTADGGRVRLEGETWSARPYAEGLTIPAGEWVEVLDIDGVTAVVHPIALPLSGT
ncbi:MAG TPA: NfeD family protein [Mycobacteriales bacterium]|nr:NfeD family protein [Mycobacteriales bacterium]